MSKFARMSPADGGGWRTALEVTEAPDADALGGMFHPQLAAQFEAVPDEVVQQSRRHGTAWTHPDAPEPPAEPEPAAPSPESYVVDVPTFLLCFLPQERVAIRGSEDPVVRDFLSIIDHPQTTRVNKAHPQVIAGIQYLAGAGLIDAGRVDQILAPEPQP